jgi:hypothetical protein
LAGEDSDETGPPCLDDGRPCLDAAGRAAMQTVAGDYSCNSETFPDLAVAEVPNAREDHGDPKPICCGDHLGITD